MGADTRAFLRETTEMSEPTHAVTLELEPLAEFLNFVYRVRRKQVID